MVDQYISRPTVPLNGDEGASDGPAAAPAAEAPPVDTAHQREPGAGPRAWSPEPEVAGGLPLGRIAAMGGALFLVAGVVGWLFARSRRRPSRRERAADAVRGTAMAAGAMAGSLGGVAALRGRLGDAMPSRRDVERRAERASKAARRARASLPR